MVTDSSQPTPPLDAALFSPLDPFDHGMLDVGDGHRLYYEQCGTPTGLPVLFLHGGPGSGCNPRQRRFFDPARYRIVLFDQRGCGRSTPRGSIEDNTTAHLVEDIERLRRHLGIERWLVFGGSWGSTLALAYAGQYLPACLGLILRGIFLTSRDDLDWFFHQAAQFLPEEGARFAAIAPRRNLLYYCESVLLRGPREQSVEAARAWTRFEDAAMAFGSGSAAATPTDAADADHLVDKYRIQAFYLVRRCFLGEARLLELAARCRDLPIAILHGRRDLVCPPGNAWRLHQALPGSRLRIVDGAGHSPFDPALTAALVEATTHFAASGNFNGW